MSKEKRLHPFFIIYGIWKLIKENFIPIILLYIVNAGTESLLIRTLQILFLIYFLGRIIYLNLKWITLRYSVFDETIQIKTGVFKKTEKIIPFDKIQNIHKQKTILHKLFGCTTLTLETGLAGGDSSVKFDALKMKDAEQLERLILTVKERHESSLEAENEDLVNVHNTKEYITKGTLLFKPEKKDLLKASFTSFSFLIIIPIIFGIYDNLDMFFNVDDITNDFLHFITQSWLITSILITILVIVSVTIGIARTFLKYGKYEIYSDKDSIYIRKGVLEEIHFSIDKNKVQAVQIEQSIIKRILRLAEVKLVTAGEAGDSEHNTNSLFPFMPIDLAFTIIEEMLPDYKIEKNMHRLTKEALLLRMIRPSYIWIIVSIIILYFFRSLWYLSIILLVIIYLNRIIDYRNSSYIINREFIQLKSGSIWSVFIISKRSKVIEIELQQSKLQKLFGLSTFKISNRSKPLVTDSYFEDAPIAQATEFYHWYMKRSKEVQLEQ